MNPSIEALLELQVIDKRRLTLRKARGEQHAKVTDADKAVDAAEAEAAAAIAEVDKLGALIRQYSGDLERCEATIADLRSKQMNAKTNKEYMAIINGVENAKVEKTNRETSVKELGVRVAELEAKAKAAQATAAALKTQHATVVASVGDQSKPTEEESQLQEQYDSIKAKIDPAFLEVYERLVKANHKMPLMRIDPKTRSTVYGSLVSQNQLEQIRMGKMVIDRQSNSILFIDERSPAGKKAGG